MEIQATNETVAAIPEATSEPAFDRQVKMIRPPANAPSIVELPESFYKLTPSEMKSLYRSHVDRRESLENRPLKTSKIRNSEELERMKRFPKTTIRIRFPDSTMLQATFKSSEKVEDIYEFVKSTLQTSGRRFLLCLPPRQKLVEPDITIYRAGLAPASNLTFVWMVKPEPGQRDIPAVKQLYLNMMEDLPSSLPSPPALSSGASSTSSLAQNSQSSPAKKAVPKWLQKGLFKK